MTVCPPLPAPEDLQRLFFIRRFEQALLDLFAQGKLNGTTHTCLGQEHVPVALMPLLNDGDFVFSNHRGHGHYLARFDDAAGLFAEITGREGAVNHGVGGSQHIKRGRYFSTGVQGESVPVAVGAALQQKRECNGGIAVAFIGDGTWGQGAVYEALNMAALWSAPLVIIVENNDIAQTTPRSANMAGTIADRARAFGAEYLALTGCDVSAWRVAAGQALALVRSGGKPLVIECRVARLGSHSKSDDTRSEAQLAAIRAADWETLWRTDFSAECQQADAAATARVQSTLADVLARGESRWEDAP